MKNLILLLLLFSISASAQRFQYDTTKYDPFPEITKSNEKGKQEYKNECIKKFGKLNGTKIANGDVWIGMTKDMAEYARGNMANKDFFIKNKVRYELYRYDDGVWLTFKGNKLVNIQ